MLDIIYSEFLKLKKSYIMSVVLIGGITMTIIMVLARLITEGDMPFEKFAYNIEQANFLILYIVLFSLIAAYVFSREFIDKTDSVLYSYPTTRIKIFIAKIITIYMLIFLVYAIEMVSMSLSYYFLNGSFPAGHLIIKDIKANLCSLLFQFLLIPIPILIANISKNIMMPVVYGVLGFISTTFMSDIKSNLYVQYYPLLAPFLSVRHFYYPEYINFNYIIIINALCFVLFMSICIYEFNKTDIG